MKVDNTKNGYNKFNVPNICTYDPKKDNIWESVK